MRSLSETCAVLGMGGLVSKCSGRDEWARSAGSVLKFPFFAEEGNLSKDLKGEKVLLLGSLGKYVPDRWSWWESSRWSWNVLEQPGGRGTGAEQAGRRGGLVIHCRP